jgi:uncharacterized phiE125 gp8 family phage protein
MNVAWPYVLTVPPTGLPLSLDEVKDHVKWSLADDSQDAYFKMLIKVVTEYAEKYTKREFITRTYETYRDTFCDNLEIRRSPLQSITTIEYLVDGVLTTVSTDVYFATLSNTFSRLALKAGQVWPTGIDLQDQAVKITFKSGYGNDLCSTPQALREAMLQHIAAMYANRGDCAENRVSGGILAGAQRFLPVDVQLIYDQLTIRSI